MTKIDKDFKWNAPGQAYSELQERYAGWTYNLAARVKQDASAAKRGATEMKKLVEKFAGILNDEQLFALKAAVSVANKIAVELDQAKPWAQAYEKHLAEKSARECRQEHMARTQKRWPTDAEAMAEAQDLVAFSDPVAQEGILAFIAGQHSCDRSYTNVDSGHTSPLRNALIKHDITQIRYHALTLIERMGPGFQGGSERTWHVGEGDFRTWRAVHLKAKLALDAVQRMSSPAT